MKKCALESSLGMLRLGVIVGVAAVSFAFPRRAEAQDGDVETGSDGESTVGSAQDDTDPIPTPDYAGARAIRSEHEIRDRFRKRPYMERFKPEAGLAEIGMYAGFFMPPKDHDILIEELPRDEYYWIAGSIGGRFAYYPASFFGVEIEGFGAGGRVKETGYSAIFYTVRGHAVAQLPFWSVTPFVLFGGGALGGANEIMGHDRDAAMHWGLGVKIPTNQRVSSRIDLRDTLAHKYGGAPGALTHYPEGHIGVQFTLNRTPPDPPRDQDYDGLHDAIDECPRQGALTVNGCPAPAESGGEPDKDGDGVVDEVDECVDRPGPEPSGCPEQDVDGDKVPDLKDECRTKAEIVNGFEDDDGCPDVLPPELSSALGSIEGVTFSDAELATGSLAALAERLVVMVKYPAVKFEVRVGAVGKDGEALAKKRGASIVRYLESKGASQGQVTSGTIPGAAEGEGATTEPAVELRIVQP